MNTQINPEAIWSERFAEIGTVIETDCDLLIERWAHRAKEEQAGAAQAHFDEMRNMLPALLKAIGRALSQSGEELTVRHCLIALEHGEQRWKKGWRLAEVVRDYQILRLVILDHLDRVLNHWPLTVRETMAVGLALDEAISASVVSYVAHQERDLRESNERLSDFMAVLGHELRNPLSAIVTTLQLLRLQETISAQQHEAYAVLDRQAAQLTRLLEDMLDVSRIARGKLQLSKEAIIAQDVIQRAVETTRGLFASRGHELVVELPESPIGLFGDPSRIEQVITNLLTNAAKYTPADGKVLVELACERDQVLIRVGDNGIGIEGEMHSHIFEMFRQQPQHRGQGLGIGLGLAKTLVEMHGGTIEAQSDGAGKGSTFTCRLPLSHIGQPAVDAPTFLFEKRTSPSERFRIVVIDDQVDALHELCLLLKLFGHEVHAAHGGQEGIDQVKRVQPQVVLLDIRMPGMDGFEVIHRLRANPQFEQTLVVAMTGYGGDSTEERFRNAGFDQILLKPVSFETVQELLASRQRATAQPWN